MSQESEPYAWKAVLDREASSDGRFVYAVVTTGIYCRPSCPARRPLRRNVRFFATPAAARSAGFRACRRCRPDSSFGSRADEAVLAALEHLEERAEENVTLEDLAAAVGVSPFHLQRQFKKRTGMTPKEYLSSLRLSRFRHRVRQGRDLTRASYEAGFGSSRGLYATARKGLGMTPGQYARRGCAQEISYCLGSCTLGRVLIASTTAGVCAVLLGESDEELVAELAREFGEASLVHTPGTRAEWTQNVLRYLDDTRIPLALPLDYHGSPFQIRVWKALRSIPPGEKQSYSELAAALGTPRAVRAVASACAQNTIAVLVPCHRVLRKDGALAGYRWGVKRKAALLARESDEPNRRPGPDR